MKTDVILSFFLSVPGHSDDNECSSNNGLGPCEQICVNTLLGHECLCRPGYNLNGDGKTCSGKEFWFRSKLFNID